MSKLAKLAGLEPVENIDTLPVRVRLGAQIWHGLLEKDFHSYRKLNEFDSHACYQKIKEMEMERIVEIVKNNVARLTHAIGGVLFYKIETDKMVYVFSVDMNDKDDVGNARFELEHKAIHLTRYLNKAIDNGSLIFYERV